MHGDEGGQLEVKRYIYCVIYLINDSGDKCDDFDAQINIIYQICDKLLSCTTTGRSKKSIQCEEWLGLA